MISKKKKKKKILIPENSDFEQNSTVKVNQLPKVT